MRLNDAYQPVAQGLQEAQLASEHTRLRQVGQSDPVFLKQDPTPGSVFPRVGMEWMS